MFRERNFAFFTKFCSEKIGINYIFSLQLYTTDADHFFISVGRNNSHIEHRFAGISALMNQIILNESNNQIKGLFCDRTNTVTVVAVTVVAIVDKAADENQIVRIARATRARPTRPVKTI